MNIGIHNHRDEGKDAVRSLSGPSVERPEVVRWACPHCIESGWMVKGEVFHRCGDVTETKNERISQRESSRGQT